MCTYPIHFTGPWHVSFVSCRNKLTTFRVCVDCSSAVSFSLPVILSYSLGLALFKRLYDYQLICQFVRGLCILTDRNGTTTTTTTKKQKKNFCAGKKSSYSFCFEFEFELRLKSEKVIIDKKMHCRVGVFVI